jgi:hypothetical protein
MHPPHSHIGFSFQASCRSVRLHIKGGFAVARWEKVHQQFEQISVGELNFQNTPWFIEGVSHFGRSSPVDRLQLQLVDN